MVLESRRYVSNASRRLSMRSLKSGTVIAAIFHGAAIACTALRLSYRYYFLRLGWDDMWAALSMAFDLVCFACALIERSPEADGTFIKTSRWSDSCMFLTNRLIGIAGTIPVDNHIVFWLIAIAFPCVLWYVMTCPESFCSYNIPRGLQGPASCALLCVSQIPKEASDTPSMAQGSPSL